MASCATVFSYKGGLITACFCLQFLLSSCLPTRMMVHDDNGTLDELSGFLDEFRILEDQVDRMKCDVDFNPSYTSLRDRLYEFELKYIEGVEYRVIRPYLYNAVLNREYNLKYNYEGNLIVNITNHLDSVKKDLDTLMRSSDTRTNILTMLNIIFKYNEQYKLNIQDRIKESNNLVKNFIKPSLEKLEYDLSHDIDSLIAQMTELNDTENGKEIEEKLEKALLWKELLTSFQLVGSVMSFLSGSVVSAALNLGVGSTSYDSLCSWNPHEAHDSIEYMETRTELRILKERNKSVPTPKIQPLTEILDKCYDAAAVYPNKFRNFLQKIIEIKQKLTTEELDFNEFQNLDDVFQKELDKNKLTLEDKDSNQNMLMDLMKLRKILAIGNFISNIFRKIGNDTSGLQSVGHFNRQTEKKLEILKKYQNGIQDMVDNVVSNMENFNSDYFSDIQKNESESSKCSLFVSNWNVQKFLKETKNNLSNMTYEVEAEDEFWNFLEGFKETMIGLVENYDHIQNYLEQKFLIGNIENIERIIESQIDDIEITYPRLIGAVDELDLVIRSNIILQRYRTAIDAFKRFVFPFASLYLSGLTPLYLNDGVAMIQAVSQIEIVQSCLEVYEYSVRNPSKFMKKKKFTSANNSSRPFYVWKNNDHRSAIQDLLSGKEILLKADISGSPIGMDAIKFEIIGLEFITITRNLQRNLTELLTNFRLRGVHLGNSYYRYDSKVYLLPTKSREFYFPFEMKGMTGEILLSPYASWRFTLVKVTDEADLVDLAKYVDEVDLELVGSGYYVRLNGEYEKGKNNDLNVEKYYKPVDQDGYNLC